VTPGIIKRYYELTKPGIIYGNLLTALAGFLFGSHWRLPLGLFAGTMLGISLVIASACVINNYIDRGIDDAMARTRGRALVAHTIDPRAALAYATILGLLGLALLIGLTNRWVVLIGLVGFIDYIVFYSYTKRKSSLSTLVGSVCGAAPIMAGYVAAVGHIDIAAGLLFAIMVVWQMPHFFAIGLYRRSDYAAAGLPIVPVVRDFTWVKRSILVYIVVFCWLCLLLTLGGYAGASFAVIMLALGLGWLWRGWGRGAATDSVKWGKAMFLYSLVVVLGLSVAVALGHTLP
jgi:protoheme IX farnesyltransferase